MALLIKNGKVLVNSELCPKDLLIEDGKITHIADVIPQGNAQVLDAKGQMILPGGVDVHTHMSLDLGAYVAVDDFYTGTVAAANGGTTTIVDHIGFLERGSSLQEMIDHYHDLAHDKAVIDYSFHGAMQEASPSHLVELDTLFESGIVSIKLYTTYGGMLEDDAILRVLKKAKETGTVVCVHCENDGAIRALRAEAETAGHLDPIYHAKTRPNVTEAEAINRLIYLSDIAGFPKLYIVHTSTKEGLEEIKAARRRGVKNLYCETCTQYLLLDESKYTSGGNEEGVKYIMAPPLRTITDQGALWDGVRNGDVDVIATDHCPFFYERDKLPHKDNFLTCPGGAPGVEERIELILTEGLKRGIALERLVDVLATNPSDIFGMSQKGRLEEGADGDVILVDVSPYTIARDNRHSRVDYTCYEGFTTQYRVTTVVSHGVIVKDGHDFYGKAGMGQFIKRRF
ncbi:dihydropyrimidinase [Peptoniphilus equinus]|uniref:Dihydropyrimidinase n=1 Tax=Peptoniphilus equinus TaxID=3016343 RepID=A0ABY7QW32_9FIRM|nr:dihydropyrimidinase [Peptoniphilus equinus]WBW50581.1 dihydropyrimidinase [Peptoniphilus equinus]